MLNQNTCMSMSPLEEWIIKEGRRSCIQVVHWIFWKPGMPGSEPSELPSKGFVSRGEWQVERKGALWETVLKTVRRPPQMPAAGLEGAE